MCKRINLRKKGKIQVECKNEQKSVKNERKTKEKILTLKFQRCIEKKTDTHTNKANVSVLFEETKSDDFIRILSIRGDES